MCSCPLLPRLQSFLALINWANTLVWSVSKHKFISKGHSLLRKYLALEMAYSDEVFYIIGVYMSIVSIISLLVNLVVIIVFKKLEKKKKGILNLLIINISISNLLQSTVTYPINVFAAFHTKWIFGDTVCVAYAFWVHLMALASINHLAVFSIER